MNKLLVRLAILSIVLGMIFLVIGIDVLPVISAGGLVLFIGIICLFWGIEMAHTRITKISTEHVRFDSVEAKLPVPTPGDRFDTQLQQTERMPFRGTMREQDAQNVREVLRDGVITALMMYADCEYEEAVRHVDELTWTEDLALARYLSDETTRLPVRERILALSRNDTLKRQMSQRTIVEIERLREQHV